MCVVRKLEIVSSFIVTGGEEESMGGSIELSTN